MRVFAAVLLSLSITALPSLAKPANDASAEDTPAAASSTPAVPDKPAAVKPEAVVLENEVQDLRGLVEEQKAELDEQRAALKAQELKMEELEEKMGATPSEPAAATPLITSTAVSSATPITLGTPTAGTPGVPSVSTTASMSPQKSGEQEEVSPLYFKIGGAEFYPLGFMDAMNVYRTTTTGTGLGTSFNSVPQNDTILARDSEDRFSIQNSRIGLRTHAKFGQADVTGYLEADFLGFQPPNADDTSNSNTLRMRLYWVDYKRGMWEVLGGQSWSMMTPNRVGLSPMPGDIFYSQDVDTNYQLGLTWARQAGIRFIAHPNDNFAIGLALENPQQTLPGGVTLPTTVSANDGSQFDTNSGSLTGSGVATNTAVPNVHPDIILKAAYDAKPGGHTVHFDVAGLFRTFDEVNLVASTPTSNLTNANTVKNSIHGGAVAATMNVELVKNLRLITTAFYGSGAGRYIASTAAPDVVVKPDGTLAGVKSGSGIGGFEYQPEPNTIIYGYYSGAYFARSSYAYGTPVAYAGYGQPGAGNSANRFMYEPTLGIHHYLWRNPSYGDIRIMTQVSYVSRATWVVNPPSLLPTSHNVMVYLDLRYDLP